MLPSMSCYLMLPIYWVAGGRQQQCSVDVIAWSGSNEVCASWAQVSFGADRVQLAYRVLRKVRMLSTALTGADHAWPCMLFRTAFRLLACRLTSITAAAVTSQQNDPGCRHV